MDYKIIVDSCGELTQKMKKSGIYKTAPLSMQVDGDVIVDDAGFDQKDFLRRIAASPECPKSSCPSPEEYMELYRGAQVVEIECLNHVAKIARFTESRLF